jgi:hypothetical protein
MCRAPLRRRSDSLRRSTPIITTTTTAPERTAEQVQRILVTQLMATSAFLASGVRILT